MMIPCDTIGAALAGYLDAGDTTPQPYHLRWQPLETTAGSPGTRHQMPACGSAVAPMNGEGWAEIAPE